MKKHLLLLFAALLPLLASAQTKVEIDGIWYNLVPKAKQAEVTFNKSWDYGGYSGSITIPAIVTYDGVEYSVPSTDSDAFDGSYPEYVTLHVPASAINDYKSTVPWSSFSNIVALTEEEMSIENTEFKNEKPAIIYDLHGRRVENPTRGDIYIVNGKKVVIK